MCKALHLRRFSAAPLPRSRDGITVAMAMALLAVLQGAAEAAGPVQFQPHRATYEFNLDQVRSGAGVSEMKGRMVYEFTGSACEGYTQNVRFVTRAVMRDGSPSISDQRSSSWEDGKAERFRFNSSQYRDNALTQQTAGDARRSAEGGAVQVDLTKPDRKRLDVGTPLFPTQHSIRLLEAALRGDRLLNAEVYEGSEKGDKVFATTAIIGTRLAAGHNQRLAPLANGTLLDAQEAWPVTLSYFEPKAARQDAVPSYEMSFLFFANGITRGLTIDYGDFSLKGELKDLVLLEKGKC